MVTFISESKGVHNSGGSRNLKTGGRCPGAVLFLRSGDCFDAPSHISYDFVVSVEDKVHIVNIAC